MKKHLTSSRLPIYLGLLTLLFVITSCANKEVVTECLSGQTYGFWWGLWHGIIAPVDLVLMFFRDDITVYAPNNNGMWYAFGFVLGSGGWGFLGGRSKKRK